ncbi:MAG: SAM-dependent methyltransferase [Butyrivibrio sp.]|nr:SAM-dependent methyltransferase [Butyrivibrio sp.]
MAMDLNMNSIEGRLSKRLLCVANMLKDDDDVELRACDVGCDHGYVSIYLVQKDIAKSAIAMDVRQGPLSGAKENIKAFGLDDRIKTRLSDGLKELSAGEANALIIAGMGGKLMIRLLENNPPGDLGIEKAVLQPQSELMEFRQFIRNQGYTIADEEVILDEGKYYFPIKVKFSSAGCNKLNEAMELLIQKTKCDQKTALNICDRFGEINIIKKTDILKAYCEHGAQVSASILKALDEKEHEARYREVESALLENKVLLNYYM